MLSIFSLVLVAGASASDLPAAYAAAAERHAVPESLLLALSWEASRWDADRASAWGGYGLFDLREEQSPSLESASMAADLDPDDVLADPALQVDAAAALLAAHAARIGDGHAPATDDLLGWWPALRAFSGSHDPGLQDRYAESVYEIINFGVAIDSDTGLRLQAQPVDHWSRVSVPPPTACDYGGCARFTDASSTNYTNQSRTASDITAVVVHTVQGSYSGCISWFQNSTANVSAHYVVRSSDGEVTQMVLEEDKAWHVGSENGYTVGIEHEGWVDEPETWYTEALYQGSAQLSADIALRNGIPIDRSHIVGHSELPNQTHTDPGTGWDWDLYMDYVNDFAGTVGSATGNLIGVVADTDIYSGAPLPGAFAWVEETGESASTDAAGYYRFYDLAIGGYTVHACADGYAEGTCTKDLSTGDNWCSIALEPGDGACSYRSEPEPDPEDTGDIGDTAEPDDPADDQTGGDGQTDDVAPNDPAPPPGDRVSLAATDTGGCSHLTNGAGGLLLVWVAGLVLVRSREHGGS